MASLPIKHLRQFLLHRKSVPEMSPAALYAGSCQIENGVKGGRIQMPSLAD